MTYKQEPPFTVKVELTEGCNLYCAFCGLRGIREQKVKNWKFLTVDLATVIARQIADLKWTSRFEFAMHGEPSMNPLRNEIINVFRGFLPRNQLMMTSNGGGFTKLGSVADIFDAGLNILALDDYEGTNLCQKIRERLDEEGLPAGTTVHEYPADPKGNPHRRIHPRRMVTFIEDIAKATKGTHSKLNNGASVAAPPSDVAAGRRCARPFRELSIRWDGNVALCCNDWRGVFKVGNVRDGIEALWHHAAMDAARRRLYRGERTFPPCLGCDNLSTRVGLLPDHKGALEMPKATKETDNAIRVAIAGAPYTAANVREWEK